MVTDEQDQAIQVEMTLRGEDICRYCGQLLPIDRLTLAAAQDGTVLGLMCSLKYIDRCLNARDERDQRTAG